ncbi:MAG: FAD binding domain-containing protein [Gammaproteobacteria bacterium]|nr:FAD binding domain-containing protein [Gammaproteobacteria bacterium]
MKPVAFDYCRPDTVEETTALLHEYGHDASVLAGGMSLGPMLNMRLVRPSVIVDINRITELEQVGLTNGLVQTGSTVRQADVMDDSELLNQVPLLKLALPFVGHFQTRNRGTLGGSVGHADPSAEIPLCLATLGGEVELASRRGKRLVRASEFFLGVLTTTRRAGELITSLYWPQHTDSTYYAFDEVAQRHGDFAIAAAACAVTLDEQKRINKISLGFGGVEDKPVLASLTAFVGAEPTCSLASEIAFTATKDLNPMEDATAGAAYRTSLATTLGRRVLQKAITEAGGR